MQQEISKEHPWQFSNEEMAAIWNPWGLAPGRGRWSAEWSNSRAKYGLLPRYSPYSYDHRNTICMLRGLYGLEQPISLFWDVGAAPLGNFVIHEEETNTYYYWNERDDNLYKLKGDFETLLDFLKADFWKKEDLGLKLVEYDDDLTDITDELVEEQKKLRKDSERLVAIKKRLNNSSGSGAYILTPH